MNCCALLDMHLLEFHNLLKEHFMKKNNRETGNVMVTDKERSSTGTCLRRKRKRGRQ